MTLSISDVTAATSLPASALRYYEQAGLIAPVGRRSGRREYDEDVLRRLSLIRLCQDAGYTIAEIADVFDGSPQARARWRHVAERKLTEIDERIARLRRMRKHLEQALACECSDLEGCGLVAAAATGPRHQRSGG